ncbi:MAG: flagellar biosynthesis protein FlhB [Sandaracinaceae bacterium]
MADVDRDQRTEEATPRKLAELREKGQVATSPDVAGAAAVVAVIATLALGGHALASHVGRFAVRALRLQDVGEPLAALSAMSGVLFREVLPVAVLSSLAIAAATLAQTRGLFAVASLTPKAERFDIGQGLQKVLPTPRMLTELGKSVLKVGLVGLLVARAITEGLPRFSVLPSTEPQAAAAEVGRAAGGVVVQAVLLLALLAAVDYLLVIRRFRRDTRMAKHEVKDEHKQQEGDPHLRAKRRAKQREVAKRRTMIQEVADATVLVTNPTHLSVALRYRPAEDAAPVILAMGADHLALQMRVEARRHGVPILENRPLARALQGTGKVGQPIPVELYEAAAPVIAHVLRLGGEA